jgi:hypothetical protein
MRGLAPCAVGTDDHHGRQAGHEFRQRRRLERRQRIADADCRPATDRSLAEARCNGLGLQQQHLQIRRRLQRLRPAQIEAIDGAIRLVVRHAIAAGIDHSRRAIVEPACQRAVAEAGLVHELIDGVEGDVAERRKQLRDEYQS